jgi:membrane protein required for colicin V production
MAAVDWICLLVLLLSLLLGAWRGLVYEVMAIAGWVIAFLAARWLAEPLGRWLPMGQASESLRYLVGFALVFIGVAYACGMMAVLARRVTRKLGMVPVDRVFGAVFGVLRGLLLLLIGALAVHLTPLHEESWWHEARSAHWLDIALLELQPLLPEPIGKYLSA